MQFISKNGDSDNNNGGSGSGSVDESEGSLSGGGQSESRSGDQNERSGQSESSVDSEVERSADNCEGTSRSDLLRKRKRKVIWSVALWGRIPKWREREREVYKSIRHLTTLAPWRLVFRIPPQFPTMT